MHTAAFRALQLPYSYGVFDVAPEYLAAAVVSLRREECRGANVTIPHKETVLPCLDDMDEVAAAVGAVNTIVNRNGRLVGYNTDVVGVRDTLNSFAEKLRGSTVLVLGAGGAARAVVYAISNYFSPRHLRVWNRSADNAEALIAGMKKTFPGVVYERVSGTERAQEAVTDSALVVNATSVGMKPDTGTMPLPSAIRFSNQQIIFDIVYNPVETALLRKARADGAQTLSGTEMFIQQGARAFELWTEKTFPVEIARDAVAAALKR